MSATRPRRRALLAACLLGASCAAPVERGDVDPLRRTRLALGGVVVLERPLGIFSPGRYRRSDDYQQRVDELVQRAPDASARVLETIEDVLSRDDAPGAAVRAQASGDVLERLAAGGHAGAVSLLVRNLDHPVLNARARLLAARASGGFPAAWSMLRRGLATPAGRRREVLMRAVAAGVAGGAALKLAARVVRVLMRDVAPGSRIVVMPCQDATGGLLAPCAVRREIERWLIEEGTHEVIEADQDAVSQRLAELQRQSTDRGSGGAARDGRPAADVLVFPAVFFDGLAARAVDTRRGVVLAAAYAMDADAGPNPLDEEARAVAADFARARVAVENARRAPGAFALDSIRGDAGGMFAAHLLAALAKRGSGPWIARGSDAALRRERDRFSRDGEELPSPPAVSAWIRGSLEIRGKARASLALVDMNTGAKIWSR